MDEYIVPTCSAIMEPGYKLLLLLDNAPSHACLLPCVHYKTVSHGTFEFELPCSPGLSPLDFFLRNELKKRQLFLNSDPDTSHCADQRHSAKHIINTHSTLRGTLHRHTQHHWHRQHTFLFQMRPLILKSARGPFSLAQHLVEKHNLHTRGPT